MNTHGGKRQGAGRKPKAEEQQLIEKLSPLEKDAYNALHNALKDGDPWAVKLWFEYVYGKPRQSTDVTTNGDSINILPIEWVD